MGKGTNGDKDGQLPRSLETWKKDEEPFLYDPLIGLNPNTGKNNITIPDEDGYNNTDNCDNEYNDDEIPPWWKQISLRGLVVSAIIGSVFCVITHKLNLTVGVIPSLNVAAGLLGFFFVKSWTSVLSKFGFNVAPFTRQENTVIQTCVVACYGIAFSG